MAETKSIRDYLQTISIILTIGCSCYILYNGLVKSNKEQFEKIDARLSALEKDVTIMKTVLMTKNFIQPDVFALKEK